MFQFIEKVSKQISEFIAGLTPLKRVAVFATGVILTGGVVGTFLWATSATYQPLMTNLNPEDATNIMRILREKKIPFRVDNAGRTISVPPEGIHDFRLELATMGLPQASVVGYEVFDKQTVGTTSAVQKLNQKRALEGELMRTVNTIQGVKRSRVHLALPTKSTFVEDQKKPTASVVLDLDPGYPLSEKQIMGIGHLVAKAVEGMDIADVVIVDSQGKTLSKNQNDPLAAAAVAQLDVRMKFERELEKRVEQLMSRVVGEGRVEAKVTAEFDFSQSHETQTVYDPDGAAVRSTEKRNDSLTGSRPGPRGAPGVASNQPGQAPPATPEIRNETNKNHEVVNYSVPETTRKVVRPSGEVKKLSVAVLLDGKQVKEKDADGNVLAKTVPWTPEKLEEFKRLVAMTVGLDPKRGDSIEVNNIEFTREDFEDSMRQVAEAERKNYMMKIATYAVVGIIIILFFVLVVRPFVKWITENTIDSVDSFLPQTIEELERLQTNTAVLDLEEALPTLPDRVDPEKVEGQMIKDKIVTLIESNPQKAALILREWIYGGAKASDKPKTG